MSTGFAVLREHDFYGTRRLAALVLLLVSTLTTTTVAAQATTTSFQQDPLTGLVSIELENFDTNLPQGVHAWSVIASGNASGNSAMQATPNIGTNNNTGFESASPRLDYLVNFTRVGTHYVWIRGQGASVDDSVHVGLDGTAQSTSDRITGFGTSAWRWSDETMDTVRATIEVTVPGEQVLNLWMREDGSQVDKIVLTTDAALQPDSFGATGPAESPRGAPQPALSFDTASEVFAADEGSVAQQTRVVSLNTSDGQPAFYSLDSSAPSWLSATPTSGTAPDNSITITVDPAGLAAGQYNGTITATSAGYLDAGIEVTLDVQADLFVVYDFDSGDTSAWTVVETSGIPSDWQAANGQYRQTLSGGPTIASTDTYLRGSYAFLNTQTNLDDFEFSVEITPEATSFGQRGNDVGVMFRYLDDNNYYRLSINSKFGQTRLERRVAGQFSTITVTSEGYLPDRTLRIGVRIQGPAMLLYRDYGGPGGVLDGEPYFAGYDTLLNSGSIALYTQSEAAFDNVRLRSLTPQPRVGLVSPAPLFVDTDQTLEARAAVINATESASVSFELDGIACGATSKLQSQLFGAECVAASSGEHSVRAFLSDPAGVDRDTATAVATGGYKAATLGDSITSGTGDEFWQDNVGAGIEVAGVSGGPRQVSIRGYQTIVHDALTADAGFDMPNVFFNEGIPGDQTAELTYDRLPSILERHPDLTAALIMIGTNDANRASPPPSGLGCAGNACLDTYKGYLLDLVDTLDAVEIEPLIARIPPIFGQRGVPYADPLSTTTRNANVREYNDVITEVVLERGLRSGPDFFDEFLGGGENRYTLFADFLHPNSLGFVWMAYAWREAIAPGGPVPFILNGICVRKNTAACVDPAPYKQNLRSLGDPYYLDRAYTLTSIPESLRDGVWLLPENDDKTISREDYLEFRVDRDVDVYIAFTPTATSLPTWMTPFTPTGETLGVTAGTPTLALYSRFYAAGSTITLGGNVAAGISGGGNNNYITIVVPR